jgi:hypothetical protein
MDGAGSILGRMILAMEKSSKLDTDELSMDEGEVADDDDDDDDDDDEMGSMG